MANALPLLLGAAAVFMLMGKKGTSRPVSVVIIEPGDTQAEIEGHFDTAAHDRVCAILSLIDGFSASQVADVARAAVVKYPRTFFAVISGEAAIEQLKEWAGDTSDTMVPVGTVFVKAGADMTDESGTPAVQLGVTAETAVAKISQAIDVALAAGQGSGAGVRQFASVGPNLVSASIGGQMPLAGSSPAAASQTGGNLFEGLISAVRQRRVVR